MPVPLAVLAVVQPCSVQEQFQAAAFKAQEAGWASGKCLVCPALLRTFLLHSVKTAVNVGPCSLVVGRSQVVGRCVQGAEGGDSCLQVQSARFI